MDNSSGENEIKEIARKPVKKIFCIKKININVILNSPYLSSFLIENNKINKYYKTSINDLNNRCISNFDLDKLLYELIYKQNSNSISNFHYNFLLFKKALNFRTILRKTKIDSLLKKCKSKFLRAVQESIKSLLSDWNRSIQIYKLPQSFVTNVNIDCNKKYLNLTILQIYYDLKVIVNQNDIYTGLEEEKVRLLSKIMNKTYKSLFYDYLNSKRYQQDCKSICEKEGEKFELLFRYVSKIFINYYLISKGNKQKNSYKKKNSEKSIPKNTF